MTEIVYMLLWQHGGGKDTEISQHKKLTTHFWLLWQHGGGKDTEISQHKKLTTHFWLLWQHGGGKDTEISQHKKLTTHFWLLWQHGGGKDTEISQHKKLTFGEKKMFPPLLQKLKPTIFQSQVQHSNRWAIPGYVQMFPLPDFVWLFY